MGAAHRPEMIVVKLMGGLGNQMFQYAAARRLSLASGVSLKLDLRWFDVVGDGMTSRPYQLAPFNIAASVATAEEIAAVARPLGLVAGVASRYLPIRTCYLKERHFHFDPALLTPRRCAYLDGYWQSERYFADAADTIAEDFSFRTPAEGENQALAQEVLRAGEGSVALHIRRGDYVENARVASFHGVCSPRYYEAAVAEVARRVADPRFFIFSDDPAWVAEHFRVGHPRTIVSHNGPDHPCEDLRLMSLCRHHVIANSTFSWWGAWLSRRPDKTVIAPRNWFNSPKLDAKDVIPKTWIKL